jgi:hypothetical protein
VHYDSIGFVMALFGLSALDAAKKLNDDFALGLSFGYEKNHQKPKYSEESHIREIQQKKRERFEQWEKESWQIIHDYLWLMREWYQTYKPPVMEVVPIDYVLDERFQYALVHYPHAEEFANAWIAEFSNEDKVVYKWVVDKMKNFLDRQSENPQKPESPRTNSTNFAVAN